MSAVETPHVERFRSLIESHLGLLFDDTRVAFLGDLLRERTSARSQSSVSGYLDLLASGLAASGESRALAEALTVNETYFYRNPDHFRALLECVLPACVGAPGGGRRLRVLSAGCASGEEAYSVAIALQQHLPDIAQWNVVIRAADVNHKVIERAIRGRYSAWSLRETPAGIRARYFRVEGSEHVLDASIRAMVSFQEQNLVEDDPSRWSPGSFDAIFCRNVIMYLAPAAAVALIDRLTSALAPGGFLFLGHAETLRGISSAFQLCHSHDTFYYRRRTEAEIQATSPAAPSSGIALMWPSPATLVADMAWFEVITASARRVANLMVSSTRVARPSTRPVGEQRGPPASPPPRRHADLGPALGLLAQERFAEALESVMNLPAESAADPDAQVFRALLLTHCGDVAEAERVCREVLERDDLNVGAHYLMALCLEHAGNHAGAVEHDQNAIYLDPAFAMPHLHLGMLARRQGDRPTARRELQQALALISREDPSRVLFFGGGFDRDSLAAMCHAELRVCEEAA